MSRYVQSEPQTVAIRLFEPELQDQVRELAEAVLCREFGLRDDLSAEDDLRDIAAAYREPHSRFVAAFADGKVVASAGILRVSAADCELRRLYVLAPYRRQGIASSLVATLLPFVKQQGYRRILLEVQPHMKDTIKGYGRYGFRPVDAAAPLPRAGEFLAIHF